MDNLTLRQLILGTIAYVFASFIVQATSHFAINIEHYQSINFVRQEPIMPLGILVMFIQGGILTLGFSKLFNPKSPFVSGLMFGMTSGLFLLSYTAIVEPSKYQVPSIASWALVEGSAGIVQFSLFGLLLGFVFNNNTEDNARHAL